MMKLSHQPACSQPPDRHRHATIYAIQRVTETDMKRHGCSIHLLVAVLVALCMWPIGQAAAQNGTKADRLDRDRQLRSDIQQRMRDRALQQRLGNRDGMNRTERTIDRTNRDAQRAFDRALKRR
jgi:hypothetical protein